jgi:hypothetical protein
LSGVRVEAGGTEWVLDPQPLRTSLTDAATKLWGLQVHVLRDGELVGVKTCFIGRIGVHARDPEAPDAPLERLLPVLHGIALAKIRERLEAGEPGDEILFA